MIKITEIAEINPNAVFRAYMIDGMTNVEEFSSQEDADNQPSSIPSFGEYLTYAEAEAAALEAADNYEDLNR
jgi:hypothetical protein